MVTLQWRTQFFLSRCYLAFVSRHQHFCRHRYHHHEFALLFHHFFFLSIVLCTFFSSVLIGKNHTETSCMLFPFFEFLSWSCFTGGHIFFLTLLFGIRQSSPAFLSSSISSSRIPVHNSIGCKNFLLVYDQFQRYSLHQKEQCISKSLTPVCAFRWFELQFQSISNISTLMIWSTKCFVQPVYKNNIVRQNRSLEVDIMHLLNIS